MPKIAFYKNLVFYIVSQDLSERWHLHISNGRNYIWPAKIWIDDCSIFDPGGLSPQELILAQRLIDKNKDEVLKIISDFQEGKKTKSIDLKLK